MYNGDVSEPTWCNGSILARNPRNVGSHPALGTIFPIFVTPTTLVAGTMLNVINFRGKELHRHVSMGIVVLSGRLHGVMVAHCPVIPGMWVRVLL